MGSGVDQYATREIFTSLRGKAPEAGNVGMGRGCSGFHFNSPLGAVDYPNSESANVQLLVIKPSNCCFQDAVWSPAGTTT